MFSYFFSVCFSFSISIDRATHSLKTEDKTNKTPLRDSLRSRNSSTTSSFNSSSSVRTPSSAVADTPSRYARDFVKSSRPLRFTDEVKYCFRIIIIKGTPPKGDSFFHSLLKTTFVTVDGHTAPDMMCFRVCVCLTPT